MYLKDVSSIVIAGILVACFFNKFCSADSGDAQPGRILEKQLPVMALPGRLDSLPVFNSNSPEVVKTDGILLSTFPTAGKKFPAAHLQYLLPGRCDFFLHHINNRIGSSDKNTVYLGLVIENAGEDKAIIKILSGATYLSQPDAPFISLPPIAANNDGNVFAGPGDRAMDDVLRNRRQEILPNQIELDPHQSALLLNCPIPVVGLEPPINGRSALIEVDSNQPLYAASMAKILPPQAIAPSLSEWRQFLKESDRAGQKEKAASKPGAPGPLIYGRVAGVQSGSVWSADITNSPDKSHYDLEKGDASFVLDSLERGTYGTGQIQTAPLVVRYDDTAFSSHGNYGVRYHIELPLRNASDQSENISITLDSPIKDNLAVNLLKYYENASMHVFFRGTVRVSTVSEGEKLAAPLVNYWHLVLHQGEQGKPIFQARLHAQEKRRVTIDFLYPPDATPPQVLTLSVQPSP